MPVPLPTAETVNLVPPDAAEAQTMADGIASAVAGHEGLLPIQQALIEAMFPAMTGHRVTRGGPAADEAPPSWRRRWRVVTSRSARAVSSSCSCARWSGTRCPRTWPTTWPSSRASSAWRRGWSTWRATSPPGRWVWPRTTSRGTATRGPGTRRSRPPRCIRRRVLREAWELSVDDPELAARWAALETLPGDTIGRKVWEMYQARGFTFPGTPGSAPPLLAQHDWVHVLADYGSTVESEVEVFGLIARANDDMHAFSLLAMVIALFETGYLARGAGLFESSPGHFSSNPDMAVRLADAMARGARCHDEETGADSIDFLRIDWFAVAHRACDDLRERFHLLPKSAAAVAAGSVGPWESGRDQPVPDAAPAVQLAAARGQRYDAHGASV